MRAPNPYRALLDKQAAPMTLPAAAQPSAAPNDATRTPVDEAKDARTRKVDSMVDQYRRFAAWTSRRKLTKSKMSEALEGLTGPARIAYHGSRIVDAVTHPGEVGSNAVKGVLGTGPALASAAGAAVRGTIDVANAGLRPYTPEGEAASERIGVGVRAVAKALKEGAKSAVQDPVGFVAENPFEVGTAVNAAGKGAANLVVKAAGAGEDAANVGKMAGPSWAQKNSALVQVAEHGPVKAAAKALDTAARERIPRYNELRTAQGEQATVTKAINDAEVQKQIAQHNDLKESWKDYGHLAPEQQEQWAKQAIAVGAVPKDEPLSHVVFRANEAWNRTYGKVTEGWRTLGRDLGPMEKIPRYQPARIEEYGSTLPKRLMADPTKTPPANAIEAQIDEMIPKRGFLTRVSNVARKHLEPEDLGGDWKNDPVIEEQFKALKDNVDNEPLPRDLIAKVLERSPDARRALGSHIEYRLQRARASAPQQYMPPLSKLPAAPGARRLFQLTREEFAALPEDVRLKKLKGMKLPATATYDDVMEKALSWRGKGGTRRVIPTEVLQQNDDWFDRALSGPNRRLMQASRALEQALDERQTTQPVYIPFLRQPERMKFSDIFAEPRPKGVRPGSPFRQRFGKTYAEGEWVKDPRVLHARMTSQLRAHQAAEQKLTAIEEAVKKGIAQQAEIDAGKRKFLDPDAIRGRLIKSRDELAPGEVAWNPDGVRMWRKQLDLGSAFLREMETFGVSEQGAAHALAEAMRKSVMDGEWSVEQMGPRAQRIYAIPEKVGEMISSEYGKLGPFGRWVRDWYDPIQGAWRWAVLSLRPAWMMNNAVGNVIFSTLNGVAPRHYLMALQKQFEARTPATLNGVRLTAQEADIGLEPAAQGPLARFARWLEEKPEQIGGPTDWVVDPYKQFAHVGDPRRFTQAVKWAGDHVNEANSAIERYFRSANYLKEAEKLAMKRATQKAAGSGVTALAVLEQMDTFSPADIEKLQAKVNFFMHDYAALNPFERSIVRRVIPFYNFLKHQTRLLLQLPVDYPGRAAALQAVVAIGKEMQAEDNAKLPPQLRDRGYVDTGTTLWVDGRPLRAFVASGGWNPFMVGYGPVGDVQANPDFGAPAVLNFLYQQSGPMWKFAEQFVRPGYDPTTGRAVRHDPKTFERDGSWYSTEEPLGEPIPAPYPDPVSWYVGQMPFTQLGRGLVNPKSGYPGNPLSVADYRDEATRTRLTQLLKYFTSASIILVDQNDARRVTYLSRREAIARLRAAGRQKNLRTDSEVWRDLISGRGRHTDVPKPRMAPADNTR